MSVATIFLCILLLPQLALVELLDFTKNPDALMEWFLSGTLLIAAVLLLRWLLKDKVSCRVRYALWAVVLVRLLLPLQFDLPVAVSSAQLAPEPPAFLEHPAFTYKSPAAVPVYPEREPELTPLLPEAVTELRKLADPDQNPRVVMGISILGSGNTRYEVGDPVTIAQLAQLLVSDPDTVAQNQHPSYDLADWLIPEHLVDDVLEICTMADS